ncbi:MAG: peptidyl-prolyl cis-trans isomerase [Betaproteobacteria bacterium]|nr:peptidyl-prolyl cis-trans isomerase [Betaproteobacteria bacterium]
MKKFWGLAFALLLSTGAFAANPQVEIKTSLGAITVELYPEQAPKTVENFLQYVKSGFYKDSIFHRVIPGFMVQGGGFNKAMEQKATRGPVGIESNNGLKNGIGTIAMARTQNPNSATAQFFINVADNGFLNYTAPTVRGYGYTVFGKVVKGMDVVERIAQLPTGAGGPFPQDVPQQQVVIEDVKLVEAK